jgi:hypothetical protein
MHKDRKIRTPPNKWSLLCRMDDGNKKYMGKWKTPRKKKSLAPFFNEL